MKTYIESENGYIHIDTSSIPKSSGFYRKALEEVERGEATIEEWEGSQRQLDNLRAGKKAAIKAEGLKRINTKVDAIDSISMAKLIYKHMWPQPNASQALLDGEAIYDYAVGKLSQASGATKEQLESYDPTTDNSWPT